jgi:hypothetical protein
MSSPQINQSGNTGATIGAGSALQFFNPFTMFVWLSWYSPIIIAFIVVFLSLIFQNFKGFMYLGFLMLFCLIREWMYKISGSIPFRYNSLDVCTSVQYSNYGNPTFSAFVFAFTFMYLGLPMFSSSDINWWIIGPLIVYWLLDIFMKLYKKCVSTGDLILNILLGAACSASIVIGLYSSGNGKYLIFNEISSSKEMCYQPSEQTFKCQVFKDGTLIGNV